MAYDYYRALTKEGNLERGDLVYTAGKLFNKYYRVEQALSEQDGQRLVLMHIPHHFLLIGDIALVTNTFERNEIGNLPSLDSILIPTPGKEPQLIRFAKKHGYSRGTEFDGMSLSEISKVRIWLVR